MDIKTRHISMIVFFLASIWLILFPPVGYTIWTHCPEYVPELILTGNDIPGYAEWGYHKNFLAFGPMLRIREGHTIISVDYALGFTGPEEVTTFGLMYVGNLFILLSLIALGIILWRTKN